MTHAMLAQAQLLTRVAARHGIQMIHQTDQEHTDYRAGGYTHQCYRLTWGEPPTRYWLDHRTSSGAVSTSPTCTPRSGWAAPDASTPSSSRPGRGLVERGPQHRRDVHGRIGGPEDAHAWSITPPQASGGAAVSASRTHTTTSSGATGGGTSQGSGRLSVAYAAAGSPNPLGMHTDRHASRR